MTAIEIYAIVVTVAAILCALGWRLANNVLRELASVEVESWPDCANYCAEGTTNDRR